MKTKVLLSFVLVIVLGQVAIPQNFEWAKSFGGNGFNIVCGSNMVKDSQGNLYVTGDFNGTVDFANTSFACRCRERVKWSIVYSNYNEWRVNPSILWDMRLPRLT